MFIAEIVYPYLHFTLKSSLWLLCAGNNMCAHHCLQRPPSCGVPCFLTGGSHWGHSSWNPEPTWQPFNAASSQRPNHPSAAMRSSTGTVERSIPGPQASGFDAQRMGRLQLQFLWGKNYSQEEAAGAGLALVRQMESEGGRSGRWVEGKGGRPAACASGQVRGSSGQLTATAVLISKKGDKVGRGNDTGGTLSLWCTHRDST